MKTNTLRTIFISLVTVALMAVGTTAVAGKGMGNPDNEGNCGGYGHHHRGYGCTGGNQAQNLTPEQREQLDTERQAFFEATKTQRQDLYAKRLELRAEMAKRQPDGKSASALQKEVSDLKASLDQKRLTHIMKVRQINPDAGCGFYGQGRGGSDSGPGKGHGRCGKGDGGGMGYGQGSCRQ